MYNNIHKKLKNYIILISIIIYITLIYILQNK